MQSKAGTTKKPKKETTIGSERVGLSFIQKLCKKCLTGKRYANLTICYLCHRGREKIKRELKAKARLLRRAKFKEKKANKPTALRKRLDEAFSLYVRARDKKCLKCGTSQNLQCSHIMSRVSNKLRWDDRNALTLCYKCHIHWWHKEPLESSEWCKEIIGGDLYEKLKKEKYEYFKPTIEFYKQMLDRYEVKL